MSKPTQLLSPRMYGLLQRIQRAQRTPFHAMTPEQARDAYAAAAEILACRVRRCGVWSTSACLRPMAARCRHGCTATRPIRRR